MRFITKDTLRIVNGLFIFLTIFQILFDLANGLTLGEIMSVKHIAIKLVVAIVLAIVFAGAYKLFSNLTEKIKFLEEKQVVKPSDENPNNLVVVAKFHDHVKAHIAKGVLETNGIEAIIFGEPLQGTVTVAANLIPMSVMVRRCDLETATKLLSTEMKEYLS